MDGLVWEQPHSLGPGRRWGQGAWREGPVPLGTEGFCGGVGNAMAALQLAALEVGEWLLMELSSKNVLGF